MTKKGWEPPKMTKDELKKSGYYQPDTIRLVDMEYKLKRIYPSLTDAERGRDDVSALSGKRTIIRASKGIYSGKQRYGLYVEERYWK